MTRDARLTPSPPPSSSKGKGKQRAAPALELLDLPGEILSQICSYLALDELIQLLSLNTALHNLTRSHLTPLRPVLRTLTLAGPPYPHALAVLPSLSHLVGHDDGNLFLDVLVRCSPKWILERFELGRWRDNVWREAFERRFLPSWKRYKEADDSWRAVFLRVLSRLEHRGVGCAHHESWTRFLALRRNGSATINRIYTRTFDPYEIFDELKTQANLVDHPTQVRVLVHLQDVRIIVLGLTVDRTSYSVNPNAHMVLHPPLLRYLNDPEPYRRRKRPRSDHSINPPVVPPTTLTPVPAAFTSSLPMPLAVSQGYLPLVRSTSADASSAGNTYRDPSSFRTHSLGATPSLLSSITGWINRPRRASYASTSSTESEASTLASLSLARVDSREERRRQDERRWLSRARSRSGSGAQALHLPLQLSPSIESPTQTFSQQLPTGASPTQAPSQSLPPVSSPLIATSAMPALPEHEPLPPTVPEFAPSSRASSPPPSPSLEPRRVRLPYVPIVHPTPAYSHRLYPNHTPGPPDRGDVMPPVRDFRADYLEVEDEGDRIWAGDVVWGGDGTRMAEWLPGSQMHRRWVGPMIVLAQLFPATRTGAVPAGAPREAAVEGAEPDLGPHGMYVSLGWEDFDALLPWVELRGAGLQNESRRPGFGFESPEP